MVFEPISFLSVLAGSITTIVNVCNTVIALSNCPDEVRTCFRLVERVGADIQYAISMRTRLRDLLQQRPEEASHFDDVIKTAGESLKSIGKLAEKLREAAHNGRVPWGQRLKWVLGESVSFNRQTADLQVHHAAVCSITNKLTMLELTAPSIAMAEQHSALVMDDFAMWKRSDTMDSWGREFATPRVTVTGKYTIYPETSCKEMLTVDKKHH
jgi:hypothetical protein